MAWMVFSIPVTDVDIHNGAAYSCHECPIALAANRLFGVPVEVNRKEIILELRESMLVLKMSCEGGQFTRDFDNERPVKPCNVEARLCL